VLVWFGFAGAALTLFLRPLVALRRREASALA